MWWLFLSVQLCAFGTLIAANEQGKKCDPKIHRLWYAVPNSPNSFIYCHPIKRLFIMEDCLFEKGSQKQFVPTVQQCIWRPSNLSTTTLVPTTKIIPSINSSTAVTARRHPMFSRYETFPRLKTIGQELILNRKIEQVENSTQQKPPTDRIDFITKCPTGRVPLRKENSNEPVECTARSDQDIPGIDECGMNREFTCAFSSATSSKGICCQRPTNSRIKCPLQMRPQIDPDGLVRPCSPIRVGICRNSGSVCVFDETFGDFHCCENQPAQKPWGSNKKAGSPKTSTTMSILLIKQPSSTLRLRKQPNNIYNEESDGCPKGETAFKDRSTNIPVHCTFSINSPQMSVCPTGYHCYESQSTKRSQCCGFNAGFCPQGSAALMTTGAKFKQRPVSCGPLSGCPDNYFCHKHTHVCCTTEPINGKCEYGQVLSQADGRAKRCSKSNCPVGYACNNQADQSYCCPTPELICSQPVDEGLFCLSAQPRRFFHYHQTTGECRPFTYSGCTDNSLKSQNKFDTQLQCERFCRQSNVCPVGEPMRKVDGLIANCTDHADCPGNYNCLSTFHGNYCCENSDISNICSTGSHPYLLRQKPMQCRSSKECVPTFECIRNEKFLFGYCCSRSIQLTRVESKPTLSSKSNCATGVAPLKTPDGEIQICLPDRVSECPAEFQCELNSYYGRYQCCPVNLNAKAVECPQGMSVQLHPRTGNSIQCVSNADCANFAQCDQTNKVCCEANDLKTLLKLTQASRLEPSLLSGLLPGQIGCISDNQCQINFPDSLCLDWICRCPNGLLSFETGCVRECPENYREQEGRCLKITT